MTADMLPAVAVRVADHFPPGPLRLRKRHELARLVGVESDTLYRWRLAGLIDPMLGGWRRGRGGSHGVVYGEREYLAASVIGYLLRIGLPIGLLHDVGRVFKETKGRKR